MRMETIVTCLRKCFHLLVLFALSNHVIKGHTIDDADRVIRDVFDSPKYNKLIRGQHDLSVPMNITIDLALKSIISVDEIRESVSLLALIIVSWNDVRLVWNSSEYNDTNEIFMPVERVWHPEVIIEHSTSAQFLFGDTTRQLTLHSSSGSVSWPFVELFEISCSFDLTSFPWDVQTCDIIFTVWAYRKDHMRVRSNFDSMMTDYYIENSSWKFDSSRVYQADVNIKSRVAYQFVLRRRPEFFLVTIFLPIICLSIMSLLVYAVPIESGERISFSLTTLLSVVLFITLVSTNVPQSADTMPAMCYFLLTELVQCVSVCTCNIISIRYYYKDLKKEKPGRFWQTFVAYCGNKRRMKQKRVEHDSYADDVIQINKERDGVTEHVDKSVVTDIVIDWKDVSKMMDRFSFIVLCLFSLLCFSMFTYYLIKGR